jgi:hypothetical protein
VTLIELPDLVQGSDDWLEQRRGMVTASVVGQLITTRALTGIDYPCPECAASAGSPCLSKVRRGGEEATPIKTLHPYRIDMVRALPQPPVLEVARNDYSRSLTGQLVAERITGFTDPVYVSEDMMRGTQDEPIAIDVYSRNYAPVRTLGFMTEDKWGWKLGYSPDGLVGDDGLVEVKSRRAKKQILTIIRDKVPAENVAQIQCGLLVSGRQWCDYISFSGGLPLYVKRVYPDPQWFEAIVAAVSAFEDTAADMVAKYEAAIVGLPMTERIDYFQDVIV